MSRRVLATALAMAAVLAACADERPSAPTSPDADPQFLQGAVCRYNDVKKFARDLFGASSPQATLAQQMSGFPANSPQATNLGFDLFAEIAKKRDAATTAAQWTTQNISDAANLTVQVINCANVTLTAGTSNLFDNLKLALTKPTGAYAVRAGQAGATATGTADPEDDVLTSDKQSGVQAVGSNWRGWFGSRTLLYGYPTSTFPGELTDAIYGTAAYDWSLVRSGLTTTYPGRGKVTVCLTIETDIEPNVNKFRLQKPTTILEIVTVPVTGVICVPSTAPTPGAQASKTSLGAGVMQFAADLLAPNWLHAAAAVGKSNTSPTANAGSFSPFQGGNPALTQLEWVYPPADGTLAGIPSATPGEPVTVRARGGQGTPWEDVLLRIYGVNNNGAKEAFFGACVSTLANGEAAFPNLRAPKVGGYTIYVETKPNVAGCSVDPDVAQFDQTTSQAPNRIIVRP